MNKLPDYLGEIVDEVRSAATRDLKRKKRRRIVLTTCGVAIATVGITLTLISPGRHPDLAMATVAKKAEAKLRSYDKPASGSIVHTRREVEDSSGKILWLQDMWSSGSVWRFAEVFLMPPRADFTEWSCQGGRSSLVHPYTVKTGSGQNSTVNYKTVINRSANQKSRMNRRLCTSRIKQEQSDHTKGMSKDKEYIDGEYSPPAQQLSKLKANQPAKTKQFEGRKVYEIYSLIKYGGRKRCDICSPYPKNMEQKVIWLIDAKTFLPVQATHISKENGKTNTSKTRYKFESLPLTDQTRKLLTVEGTHPGTPIKNK